MENLTLQEKIYLAGFFDGEGCISIAFQKPRSGGRNKEYYLLVFLSQSNKPFLAYWQQKSSIGRIYKVRDFGTDNRGIKCTKAQYKWQISSRQAVLFLRGIYDYLIIKKPQADIAFVFQDTKSRGFGKGGVPQTVIDKRQWCLDELKRLKKDIGKEDTLDNRNPSPAR